jgi:hypothetical protein
VKERRDRSLCSCRDCERDRDEEHETENLHDVGYGNHEVLVHEDEEAVRMTTAPEVRRESENLSCVRWVRLAGAPDSNTSPNRVNDKP